MKPLLWLLHAALAAPPAEPPLAEMDRLALGHLLAPPGCFEMQGEYAHTMRIRPLGRQEERWLVRGRLQDGQWVRLEIAPPDQPDAWRPSQDGVSSLFGAVPGRSVAGSGARGLLEALTGAVTEVYALDRGDHWELVRSLLGRAGADNRLTVLFTKEPLEPREWLFVVSSPARGDNGDGSTVRVKELEVRLTLDDQGAPAREVLRMQAVKLPFWVQMDGETTWRATPCGPPGP